MTGTVTYNSTTLGWTATSTTDDNFAFTSAATTGDGIQLDSAITT